ncbi:MAG: alpha-amylase family glycosyl hydrolase [Desulfosarcinaceae bacterium]|nr:alpha-amylase family glycosyl hydrolase [Desulfosarcinaceae bacterium]
MADYHRDPDWWKRAVIYQIYPRSFYDANNDGIGDLAGITAKLDYLNDGRGGGLGVDAIWISPFFTSPMADFGYDVADYTGIDPIFGTMDDFDALITAAHQRGIGVIIDMVFNHSSDQHPWFVQSRRDRTNPKADWYIWADPKPDGSVPNNWLSFFGGPAWTWDERRGQYYYHTFLKEQPDLNWYQPAMRAALADILRFWMKKGVDGFRFDVVNFLAYDRQLRDNPEVCDDDGSVHGDFNPYDRFDAIYSKGVPEQWECVEFLRTVMDEGDAIASVGEVGGIRQPERLIAHAAEHVQHGRRLHMAYTFAMLTENADLGYWLRIVEATERVIGDGWPCWSMGNHDSARLLSRFDCRGPRQGLQQAALLFLLTIRGTPILYYGEEIDMAEVALPREQVQDPFGIRFWPDYKGRDGCRSPFPWTADLPNCGFNSGADPWLPLGASPPLDQAAEDPHGTLAVVREMLRLRRSHPALMAGSYKTLMKNGQAVIFERRLGNARLWVAVNVGGEAKPLRLRAVGFDAERDATAEVVPLTALARNGRLAGDILELPGYGFALIRFPAAS